MSLGVNRSEIIHKRGHRYLGAMIFLCSMVSSHVTAQPSEQDVPETLTTIKAQAPEVQAPPQNSVNDYRLKGSSESEFDNSHDPLAEHWIDSKPASEYEDTEFGEQIYNEASVSTKLEVLRLLSKETPSNKVFLTALSMGLGVEETLQAAVRYQPEKARELAAAAVSTLPLLSSDTDTSAYSTYELSDVERKDPAKPYEVAVIAERFFENRQILRPFPDWFQGQYHFLAAASELIELADQNGSAKWYQSQSSQDVSNRPIFISLYEDSKSVLIDSESRIRQAVAQNSKALLPVVFVFNRFYERAISNLEYPKTIRGVEQAYRENNLMLTSAPEWQVGEYHFRSPMKDIYEAFEIPSEQDFEQQAWQNLLADAKNYSVNDTSFLVTIINTETIGRSTTSKYIDGQQYAKWDNPRTESAFPYVEPGLGEANNPKRYKKEKGRLTSILREQMILNRPDLIAALNALGVTEVPIAFYYFDDRRQRPFLKTPKALIQSAIGAGAPPQVFGGDGGFSTPVCASPPCTEPQ